MEDETDYKHLEVAHRLELSADANTWHWSRQKPGTIPLPDFIRMKADGTAKIENGIVYLKKPGYDPESIQFLQARILQAEAQMKKAIIDSLYKGTGGEGLASLFKDE